LALQLGRVARRPLPELRYARRLGCARLRFR